MRSRRPVSFNIVSRDLLTEMLHLFASVNLAKQKVLEDIISIFLCSARLPIVMASDKQESRSDSPVSVKLLTHLFGQRCFLELCSFMAFPGPKEKENLFLCILAKIGNTQCFACLLNPTANILTAEVQFITSDHIKSAIPSCHIMMSFMVTIR